jgi:hypothetical protein
MVNAMPYKRSFMPYSNSVAFNGDPQRLLAAASTILMTNGFAVIQQEGNRIEFVGPGLNSTKQNAILGASKVIVCVENGRLAVEADYGGVDSLRRFMIRFPLLLGLGLGSVFAAILLVVFLGFYLYGADFGPAWTVAWLSPLLAIAVSLLSVSPWIFLAPWIRRHLERKTKDALDTLMINVSHAAKV